MMTSNIFLTPTVKCSYFAFIISKIMSQNMMKKKQYYLFLYYVCMILLFFIEYDVMAG
jgi:hypothetical protein